jgi:hypothetical protein
MKIWFHLLAYERAECLVERERERERSLGHQNRDEKNMKGELSKGIKQKISQSQLQEKKASASSLGSSSSTPVFNLQTKYQINSFL